VSRYEEIKKELAATVQYGKIVAEKLQNPDLSKSERADLDAEQEATLTKAEALQREGEAQLKADERDLRIKSIGRDMDVELKTDEVVEVEYSDPVEHFLKSDQWQEFAQDVRAGRHPGEMSIEIDLKAAKNVETEYVGDLTTQMVPGMANFNYQFPYRVGERFGQGTMSGSNVSFLKIPAGATGAAAYQANLGDTKGGDFGLSVDIDNQYAKTIAARALIPEQNLDDIDALESEIRNLLLVGPNGLAELREDDYINGNGTTELEGILSLSPDDATLSGDYFSKSVLWAAANLANETGFVADTVLANPVDAFYLRTEVGTVDNRPLNTPYGSGWNQNYDTALPPIVETRKLAVGQVIVGQFSASTRYTRKAVTITADAAGLGLRDKNLVLFVAEVREALVHRYGADPYRTVDINT
jgi:hypothetical protein